VACQPDGLFQHSLCGKAQCRPIDAIHEGSFAMSILSDAVLLDPLLPVPVFASIVYHFYRFSTAFTIDALFIRHDSPSSPTRRFLSNLIRLICVLCIALLTCRYNLPVRRGACAHIISEQRRPEMLHISAGSSSPDFLFPSPWHNSRRAGRLGSRRWRGRWRRRNGGGADLSEVYGERRES
jgi:hypothetical protein